MGVFEVVDVEVVDVEVGSSFSSSVGSIAFSGEMIAHKNSRFEFVLLVLLLVLLLSPFRLCSKMSSKSDWEA